MVFNKEYISLWYMRDVSYDVSHWVERGGKDGKKPKEGRGDGKNF